MQRISFKHSSHDRNWNHDKHNCVCPWPPNTMEKRKYIPTSQDINKATLYLYSLCLAIRNTSLDFSALRFATLFRSRAFASSARALSLSFFTASASAARLVNLSHKIGVVSRPRGHVLLSPRGHVLLSIH